MHPAFQLANVPGESRQEATGRTNVQLCAAWLRFASGGIFGKAQVSGNDF